MGKENIQVKFIPWVDWLRNHVQHWFHIRDAIPLARVPTAPQISMLSNDYCKSLHLSLESIRCPFCVITYLFPEAVPYISFLHFLLSASFLTGIIFFLLHPCCSCAFTVAFCNTGKTLITLFNSGYRVSEETHHAQSILFTVINSLSYFNLIILIYFTLFGIYKIISDSVPTANSLYHLECHLQLLQPSLASYELCIRSELHYIWDLIAIG